MKNIFLSDRFVQLVSGGRGYDRNCAVVIDTDDYEILMPLEREYAKKLAFCEVEEAPFYADSADYDYKFKRHELYMLGDIPYDVIYSEITLHYDDEEGKPCTKKYHSTC